MQDTNTTKAGERTQGGTTAYGFLNDLSNCSFHFGENMRDLTIRGNDGGKIGLQFTDKIAALRIDRDQTPEVIAAAPDLLKACKSAIAMFNEQMFVWGDDDDKQVGHMTKDLCNAIARAEGRAQ